MGSKPGKTHLAIAVPRLCQLPGQAVFGIPAWTIIDSNAAQFGNKDGSLLCDVGLQSRQTTRPHDVYFLRQTAEIMFPRSKITRRCALAKQGVPLTQRTPPSLPQNQGRMFHVEHTPIEKSSALFGRAENQCLAFGPEVDNRAGLEQGRQARQIRAIEPPDPSVLRAGQPESRLGPPAALDFSVNEIAVRPVTLGCRSAASPKRAAMRKNVGGLQQCRLAGAIRPDQPIDSRSRREAYVLETTQITRPQQFDIHGVVPRAARRGDCVTAATALPRVALPGSRHHAAGNLIGRRATAVARSPRREPPVLRAGNRR